MVSEESFTVDKNVTWSDMSYTGVTILNYIIFMCGIFTVVALDLEVSPQKQASSYIFLALLFCIPVVPLPLVTLVAITIMSKMITYIELNRMKIAAGKVQRTELKN